MCIHCMIISTPEYGKHLIGICKYCGKVTDYTELQEKCPILSNSMYFTREDISMDRIMASLNGGKKTRGRPKKMEC